MIMLLSVRPEVAEAILSGEKTAECRRRRPFGVGYGTLALLYASKPVQRVVGSFLVEEVICDERPRQLWRDLRRRKLETGMDRGDFLDYMDDATRPCAMTVLPASTVRFDPPHKLPIGLAPPQSYVFLDQENPIHQLLLRRL